MELDGPAYAYTQIAVSAVCILLQCITVPVFLAHREFRQWICYRLMLTVACFDLLQLFPNFLFQIFYISGTTYGSLLENLCGASFTIAWDCLVFCQLLLAANRLLAVLKSIYSPTATDYTPPMETIAFNSLLAFIWLYFFAVVALFMTPLAGTKFFADPKFLQFYYDFDLPYSGLYQSFELYATTTPAGVCVAVYILIVAFMKKNRLPGVVQASGEKLIGPLTRQEFRVLLQSGILFLGMLFLTLDWYLGDGWLPAFFEQLHLTTFFFLGYCGLNPLFLITLNAHFRSKFKAFYKRSLAIFPATSVSPQTGAVLGTTTKINTQVQQVLVGGGNGKVVPGGTRVGGNALPPVGGTNNTTRFGR